MKQKILIVEDEPAIADTIQYALETEGFDTKCLAEGRPVQEILARENFAMIILDIGLPDINGIELCKQLREKYSLPIIFLTARSDEIDKIVGLEIGADDYITKPFSPRELSARIKAILRRAAHNADSKSKGSVFQTDESRRKITYFNTPLDLSYHEYNLMKVFISRPGFVFSRDQLMDLAWDEPETSMDRTVDAHIKNIRAKLKSIKPEIDPIRTNRGMGYSLKEDI